MSDPTFLITADWHLTSRALDEYRWQLFPWLRKQIKARGVSALIVAGDIADLKDNHPAALVNRVVDDLTEINEMCPVFAIPGNHDYTDPANPYFRFLAHTGVNFFTRPTPVEFQGTRLLFLPHTKRWRADWGLEPHSKHILSGHDLVVLHQPIKGAVTESGDELAEGLAAKVFRKERVGAKTLVVAGDIHVPQQVGNVVYTGAPYPVHFGDSFMPRVLLWEKSMGDRPKSLPRPCLQKMMARVESADDLTNMGLTEGDMVKVKLILPRSEYVDWQKRKREIEKTVRAMGVTLCGVEVKEKAVLDENGGPDVEKALGIDNPRDRVSVFQAFCRERGLNGDIVRVGVEVIQS